MVKKFQHLLIIQLQAECKSAKKKIKIESSLLKSEDLPNVTDI